MADEGPWHGVESVRRVDKFLSDVVEVLQEGPIDRRLPTSDERDGPWVRLRRGCDPCRVDLHSCPPTSLVLTVVRPCTPSDRSYVWVWPPRGWTEGVPFQVEKSVQRPRGGPVLAAIPEIEMNRTRFGWMSLWKETCHGYGCEKFPKVQWSSFYTHLCFSNSFDTYDSDFGLKVLPILNLYFVSDVPVQCITLSLRLHTVGKKEGPTHRLTFGFCLFGWEVSI